MSKEKFLLNKVNKQELLRHLIKYMNCHACIKSVQLYADSDVLIATAVERSRSKNIDVIDKDRFIDFANIPLH